MAPHLFEHERAIGSGWLAREDPEWAHAWSHFPDPVMAPPFRTVPFIFVNIQRYNRS
jgi:hypothetical protein